MLESPLKWMVQSMQWFVDLISVFTDYICLESIPNATENRGKNKGGEDVQCENQIDCYITVWLSEISWKNTIGIASSIDSK
jgi:hypothetical protein